MRRRPVDILVPVTIAGLFALLNLLPLFRTAERRVYDLFLHLRPPVAERPEILLLDVDDTAIANVGIWPWSRDYMARGLVLLTELEAGYVTFDIEYVDRSPQAVDGRYLRDVLPARIDGEFAFVQGQIRALFRALADGQIPLDDAEDFIDQLAEMTDEIRDDLKLAALGVVQDHDTLLGQAARFHGNAYFTVNVLDDMSPVPADDEAVISRARLQTIEVAPGARYRTGADLMATIPPVALGGRGAGFPNVVVDSDGVRRRIDLVARVEDTYFAQLVLPPLLDWLGGPSLSVRRDSVILDRAVIPGTGAPRTIRIPLSTDGRMLINWPKADYDESFRHLTYWRLVKDWLDEEAMVERLRVMDEQNYLFYYEEADVILAVYDYSEAMRWDVLEGGDRSQIDEWRALRAEFFAMIGRLLQSGARERLVADIEAVIATGLDADAEAAYRAAQSDAEQLYDELGRIYAAFTENREVLQREIPGSFIIIGHVGTSTTDIGVTPFDEEYMNVGTHASVVNTILQEQFLVDLPWWVALVVMAIAAVLVTLLTSRLDPLPGLFTGMGVLAAVIAGGIGLFVWTGVYVNMVTPVAGGLLTFIAITVVRFIRENREKMKIRDAFQHYMAPEVVRQVTENPELLTPGGVERELTAMFTDLKGFSTISESLEPRQLTDLLNRYLGAMCDIILDEGGTIDKFEGDAIIAFWNAPLDVPDHPVRACRAAVRMKQRERELNEELALNEGRPLLTRIGINTGSMVVGNMGTQTRLDYTAMGHNMNLAARLEGVNKEYSTWIMVSEQTYNGTKDDERRTRHFTVRKLDRVRVVGISEPVRLYELIDLRAPVDKDPILVEKLRTFNAGLNAFEAKQWAQAGRHFADVLGRHPDDGPALYYADRCKRFELKPPANDWDGVFNRTSK